MVLALSSVSRSIPSRNVAKEVQMSHKPWKLLLSFWATSLAWAIVTLFTLAADSSAQETLQPYATPILHSFLDSRNVYPESVTVDQSSGTFFVGSVKEGTIYKGKIARPSLEVFSPGGADGRTIATGMFFTNDRLVVVGRQTGLIFVYNTKNGRLISKLDNGLRTGQTFLNDTTFAPDGSAYVTDSVNPVLYRVVPTMKGQYELQEFLKFEGTPVVYVNAPGAEGINVNGIVATADGRYLIIGKRNENRLFRVDLKSREIVPLNMPAGMLNTPDGLFLEGTTLYVAQNVPKSIAVVKLSSDFSQAELERTINHPTFAFPTSVARYKNRLLVVSSQFDTAGSPAAVSGTQSPVVPFWVTQIRERIVTAIPLEFIWTDEEQLAASRERYLTPTDLTEMLKLHPVEFIVAELGVPLKRISVDKCYEFWESEVKRHLLSPHRKVDRSNLPDEYGYLASEWSGQIEAPIVLLEKIH
jgi:sugar lactone lactonase YvrE